MKKKLLFAIDSLDCAGAEKSLVTLLSLLDYTKYSVDLMLFAHETILESLVPKEVTILKPLKYTEYTKLNIKQSLIYTLKNSNYKMLYSRMKYSIGIRKENYRNSQKARVFWQSVSKNIEKNSKYYDVAISYAQGVPTFYIADKVRAKKKFAWVNVSYKLKEQDKTFQKDFYDKYNKIVAVSDTTKEIFLETFPDCSEKVGVIHDINNPDLIVEMANIGESYDDNFTGVKILTIGRLDYQKGYDIALNACERLKENGINFRWYVLGKGPQQKEIEEFIDKNNLTQHFILLGTRSNPYPFIKNADIYVQTSKFEGFGLAIAEARMLNVPVVTTRFDAVYAQMVEGKNGIVVDMNPEAVSDGIMQLINDKELRETIIQYLRGEKKGNIEEVEKFYQLLG
ncbi:glycosyltransferase [Virgibacillus necropolis]|uniref:Glycosyl transferase n=1 Tax=Virgibacillus necropolis TaxID=163877 RepID=A0A221ME84_9BACI|nr:glycosyltransferase [Virgibacillus necropolis]ASN05988.1 glycosyl transferase [Virgibacillus necropolis]